MDALAELSSAAPKVRATAPNPVVAALATQIRERALREDAALTQDVYGALDHIGATYRDRRVKSVRSLTAKILRRPGEGVYAAAANIRDALAYYAVFDASVFESRYHATLMALERQGHRLIEERSYWKEGNRHKGSHALMLSRNGLPFEIQFHTRASLDAKRLSDALYTMLRDPAETDARRLWAEEQCRQLMGGVALPTDVYLLGTPQTNHRRM
jgi:hypothetical protein